MAKVKEMQGVPAHLEYLKTDGKRRHPAHCVFHDGVGRNRICTNTQSDMYNRHCNTSKNCDHYKEKEK